MIKCEMHLHIKGISPCAKVEPERIAQLYSEAGYGAICVTNHYMHYLFDSYDFPTEEEKVEFFINSYKSLKESCKKYNINVFLGMELNLDEFNTEGSCPGAELLCYGVTEEFLRKNLRLYSMTHEDFFRLSNENGIVVCQSHPFRPYCKRTDHRFLHGAEVYNGHRFHDNNNHLAEEFAASNNLIGVSGSDFHEEGESIRGGIFIPEEIKTSLELADFLKRGSLTLIRTE